LSALFFNNYFEFLNWCGKYNAIKNNDTIKNDTIKNDTIKNDTIKNDTIKNDTIKNDTNHTSFIKFKNTNETCLEFINYITKNYNTESLVQALEQINDLHGKILNSTKNELIITTTRMTLFG